MADKNGVKTVLAACLFVGLGVALLCVGDVGGQRVRIIQGGNSPARPGNEPAGGGQPAVEPIDPTTEERARIAELIELLGHDHVVVRDRAMSDLAAFEARALGQVREAKNHDHDEISNRCYLLEEVILSRQGELFLSARRLGLSIAELNALLSNNDVTPLLDILRTRAQAGMTSMWARVLAMLISRTQVFTTAVVCRDVEGDDGYGRALAIAAGTPEAKDSHRTMQQLIALLPPGDPADAVEALARLAISIGGGGGLDIVIATALDLRGAYTAAQLFAAREGRPDPTRKEPDGARELRTIIALNMITKCSEGQLSAAGFSNWAKLSPALFNTALMLVQRSGLRGLSASILDEVIKDGADPRYATPAAATFAAVHDVAAVVARFDNLPLPARLAVLDTWWMSPREPVATQRFLLTLLAAGDEAMRPAAARLLGQYRAHSTVRALLAALADAFAAPAAAESLSRMGDLLTDDEQARLVAMLPTAPGIMAPYLVSALSGSAADTAVAALAARWRDGLSHSETSTAIWILAQRPQSPAGAYAAAVTASLQMRSWHEFDSEFLRRRMPFDHAMMVALLRGDDATGFALLESAATDITDPARLRSMAALAMAGKDGPLISDWLKRLTGEVSEPMPGALSLPVALSTSPEAEAFRRSVLQQGAAAAQINVVRDSVLAGRSSITTEELEDVLFSTPAAARTNFRMWYTANLPLTEKAARNLAMSIVFSAEGASQVFQPATMLTLQQSGVDLLEIMFGDDRTGTPRDTTQIFATALLGEPGKAAEILRALEPKPDGSDFMALMITHARLGILEGRDGDRLRTAVARSAGSVFGMLDMLRRAETGEGYALASVLDAYALDYRRYQFTNAAEVSMVFRNWDSPRIEARGAAPALYAPLRDAAPLSATSLRVLFDEAPPADWRNWWHARRALLEFNPDTGRYTFTELP